MDDINKAMERVEKLEEALKHSIQFCTWIGEDSLKLKDSEVATLARRNKVTYCQALGEG